MELRADMGCAKVCWTQNVCAIRRRAVLVLPIPCSCVQRMWGQLLLYAAFKKVWKGKEKYNATGWMNSQKVISSSREWCRDAQGETGSTGNERRAGPNALKSRNYGNSKGCVIGSKGARRGHVVKSKEHRGRFERSKMKKPKRGLQTSPRVLLKNWENN